MSESNQPNRSNPGPSTPTRIATATQIVTEISSGPIPTPQVLQQYNGIVPGAAERIIRMAEKQSDHRMDLERRVIYSNIKKSYFGMILATSIAMYGLYIAKEISMHGNPATAGIIATLDMGGLISVAIYNVRAQRKERAKRKESSSSVPTHAA